MGVGHSEIAPILHVSTRSDAFTRAPLTCIIGGLMFSSATGRSTVRRLAIVTSDRATKCQAGKSATQICQRRYGRSARRLAAAQQAGMAQDVFLRQTARRQGRSLAVVASVEWDRRGCGSGLGRRWLHTPGGSGEKKDAEKKEEKDEKQQKGQAAQVQGKVQDGPGSESRETWWTTPNLITMTRIVFSPLISYWILEDHYELALAGVAVAGFTDWLDGYIAKNYNQTSILGGFLDPFADKVLVAVLAVPLAYKGHLPPELLFVWVGRDALLIAGSFVKRVMERPEGSAFFDTTGTATFQIMPNQLSKFNTALQFTVLGMSVCRAMCGVPGPEIFDPLCWLVGGTTVASGLTYLMGDGTGLLKKAKGLTKKK